MPTVICGCPFGRGEFPYPGTAQGRPIPSYARSVLSEIAFLAYGVSGVRIDFVHPRGARCDAKQPKMSFRGASMNLVEKETPSFRLFPPEARQWMPGLSRICAWVGLLSFLGFSILGVVWFQGLGLVHAQAPAAFIRRRPLRPLHPWYCVRRDTESISIMFAIFILQTKGRLFIFRPPNPLSFSRARTQTLCVDFAGYRPLRFCHRMWKIDIT